MGGQSSQDTKTSQTTASTTNPYAPTQPGLQNITDQITGLLGKTSVTPAETSAFAGLSGNAQSNPYAAPISGVANNLLAGGGPDRTAMPTQSYDALNTRLSPYADGSMMGQNAGLQPYLDSIRNDVSNQVNGQFAAAGRDMSGMNQQALGRGIAQGEAPVIANQFNTDTANRLGAASTLYGAGNTTTGLLSGLDQTRLGNQTAGVDVAGHAIDAANQPFIQQLAIEAQRRGIPLSNLAGAEGLLAPIAALGGTSTGTSNGTSNTTAQMSGVDQFLKLTGGIKNLFGSASSGGGGGGGGGGGQ